jgi:SnoaL-like domain
VISSLRSIAGAAPDIVYADQLLAGAEVPGGGTASLAFAILSGRSAEHDVTFSEGAFQVAVGDERTWRRVEMFSEDQADAAWARYEELRSPGAATPAEGAAQEIVRRFNAHDVRGLRELFAPECAAFDHRGTAGDDHRGIDEITENMRTMIEYAIDTRMEWETLAASDRVIAGLSTYSGPGTLEGAGPWAGTVAVVRRVDGSGRVDRIEVFDEDDRTPLLRCFAELAGATALWTILDARDAYNARDWEVVATFFAPEFVYVDRRSAGAGTFEGAAEAVAVLRSTTEVVPDIHWQDLAVEIPGPDQLISRVRVSGHDAEGGEAELEIYQLMWSGPDGRLVRIETFDTEAEARARADV